MLARGADRAVTDGIALEACTAEERALYPPLGRRDRPGELTDHIGESAHRGVHGLAELGDLPVVLDEAEIAERLFQFGVALLICGDGGLQGRVEAPDDPARRTGGGGQVAGRRANVPAGQTEHELRLGKGSAPPIHSSAVAPVQNSSLFLLSRGNW